MSLIESRPPDGWRDLQSKVHRILIECGMTADIERQVQLARGTVEVDVFAEDPTPTPPAVYLCECKNWANAIPQSVIHGFRTVVIEAGANLGLLISKTGFQTGAHDAAKLELSPNLRHKTRLIKILEGEFESCPQREGSLRANSSYQP